jgi:hypothetical protein
MSRRNAAEKRIPEPDPIFGSQLVNRFINRMMQRGKKSTAQGLFYESLALLKDRAKGAEPMDVFNKAVKNVTPLVEVKARRVGGSTYQVPVEVKQQRGSSPTAESAQAERLPSVSPVNCSMLPTVLATRCVRKTKRTRWPKPTKLSLIIAINQ